MIDRIIDIGTIVEYFNSDQVLLLQILKMELG